MKLNNIYKINEILENKYYQIPQELFENEIYKNKLGSDSKILYAFLLDRLTLSSKNNWVNENGEVYLIFTRVEVGDKLNLCDKTVSKAFKQLIDTNLIYEKRQGLGKPNIIYVGKIQHQQILQDENFQTRKKYNSVTEKNTTLDTNNLRAINTNNINTNKSNNNLILSNYNNINNMQKEDEIDTITYKEIFKKNIEYNILIQDERIKNLVNNITDVAVDIINTKKDVLYVNSEPKNANVIRSQLLKLKSNHIMYVINCLKNNIKDVRSIKSYILTALYNAVNTFEIDVAIQSAKLINGY